MATFWKEIRNRYSVDTYQNTKNTYDWITKALNKGNFDFDDLCTEFLFNVSDITCSCSGIEEFVENAYEQMEYHFARMSIFLSTDAENIHIIVDHDDRVSVSTKTKVLLERVINLLEDTSLDEAEASDPISVTYIETQVNNDGILINGNQNNVANNHSEIKIKSERNESGETSFWTGILQNITSNFVWYLLTLAAGALLAYFTMK